MKQKKIIHVFLIFFLITTTIYGSTKRKVDLFTGNEIPISSKVTGTFAVTLEKKERTLAEAKSSFNCETGEIKIDAAVINNLNEMLQTFGSNASESVKNLLKEMATQATIELSLEVLARIHYMTVQSSASSSSMLIAIKLKDVAKCVTSGFYNALESEIELGLGMNIYDMMTGKIGINFVSIAGIYPCIKEQMGEPKDERAKKALDKSRQWVRFLFYKLLNSSFDTLYNLQLSAGQLSAKCKEVKMQLKKDNFGVVLAQLGEIITPNGTKVKSKMIVAEPKRVGKKVPPEKEPTTEMNKKAKEDADAKAAGNPTSEEQADQEIENDITALGDMYPSEDGIEDMDEDTSSSGSSSSSSSSSSATKKQMQDNIKAKQLKKAAKNVYIEEVNIKTTIITNENKNIIDMTDFKEGEIIDFNNKIYNQVYEILKNKDTIYNQNIQSAFFLLLKRILTITTKNLEMEEKRKEIFKKRDLEQTSKPFLFTKTTPMYKVLDQTEYYGKLRTKFEYYQNLIYGNLSKREKNEINNPIMAELPNGDMDFKEVIRMNYYNKVLKKLDKADKIRNYIASGEEVLLDGTSQATEFDKEKMDKIIYNEYQYDLQTIRNSTSAGAPDNSIHKRINPNILLRKPLHELEYLRLLYEAESRDVLFQLINTNPGEQMGGLIMSKKVPKIDINNKEFIEYAMKKIKLVKEIYAIKLLSAYANRAEAIKYWVMKQFQKTSFQMTDSLKSFYETEFEKFKYKLKQKRLLIRLMLEKEVK